APPAQPTPDAPTGHNPQQPIPPTSPDRAPPEPAPQINQAGHPDNRLYTQALTNLEQLGPNGGFKSREELERAAGALAVDAKLSGLTQIDHVARSKNGEGLIAVQGNDPWAPEARRAFLDVSQATSQTLDQSTRMANEKAAQQAQPQQPQQPRNDLIDSPILRDENQTRPKSVMV
ncbi:MAG: hypothetical protein IT473_09375, partial [Lysobacter sp.]|nr:hypothetical protein [Lysobacter sp.]